MNELVDSNTERFVCCEPYNNSSRVPVSCIKCDISYCKKCFKTYITDQETLLQCMGCKVEFDRTSLSQHVDKTFMRTGYRDIRKHVLFEHEKSLFPATQEIIEVELEVERLREKKENLSEKYAKIKSDLVEEMKAFRYSSETMPVNEAFDKYFQMQAVADASNEQLSEERRTICSKIDDLRGNSSKPAHKTYVLSCTHEGCKGLLSNETRDDHGHYRCSICNNSTCESCRMEVSQDGLASHECDPEVLKTVQFLAKSSKPCPSCGVPIHKISGCDQMFCTRCHASFSWRTMLLNNGEVHNPYHAAWLRENRQRPREIGDIPCGREITTEVAVEIAHKYDIAIQRSEFTKAKKVSHKKNVTFLFEAIRVAIHHHHVTLPSLSRSQDNHQANQSLRIALLRGHIDEDTFKNEIQKRDKASSKKNDLFHLVQRYRDSLTDIMFPMLLTGETNTPDEWLEICGHVKNLQTYVNNCFARIANVYGSKVEYDIMSDRSIR